MNRWIGITVWNREDLAYSANTFEQINDYLFVDTYKLNKIKVGANDMTMNDSKMCMRWKDEAWSIMEISVLR